MRLSLDFSPVAFGFPQSDSGIPAFNKVKENSEMFTKRKNFCRIAFIFRAF